MLDFAIIVGATVSFPLNLEERRWPQSFLRATYKLFFADLRQEA